MASSKEDSLDKSRVPVYRIFKSNIRERVRLFSTLIVEDSNSPEGNFLEHCDPTELSIKHENFAEEEANFNDTKGDNKAALKAEIDNQDLGIQRKRRKIDMNCRAVESPLFNANPFSTAGTQEEEIQVAEGIENILVEKITKSATKAEKSFKSSKTIKATLKVKRSLQSNQTTNSKTSQRFRCKICGQLFKQKTNSKKHEYTHMNWEELEKTNIYHEKCGICHKIFFQKRNYEDHINHHNKVQPHQCRKCDRKFIQIGNLTNHILRVHSTAEKLNRIRKSWKNECNIYNKKFPTPSELTRHKLSHSDLKSFNCSQCDKKYNSKRWLTNHQRMHDGRLFKCDSCKKQFNLLSNLKRHELIHSNQKNFNCYFCHKQFIQRGNLTTHMNAVHLNEKAFNCDYCKKGYADKSALTKHVKSVHLSIKISCPNVQKPST